MTNFSLSSALKAAFALSAAVLAGCGGRDGLSEFAEGQAAYERRDLPAAAKLFEKSLACAPRNVDALVALACVKLDLGDIGAAKGLVDQAAALDPKAVDVRMLAARVAWFAKDYAEASRRFRELAEDGALDAQTCADSWTGEGIVRMATNERDLARVAFLRAIRLDRRNAPARYHLGLLYRDAFHYDEAALEQFEIYVRLETESSSRMQKTRDTVIPELKEAIKQARNDRPGASKADSARAASLIAKAEAVAKGGTAKDLKAAFKLYQSAYEADPLSYPAALGLGRMQLKVDKTKSGMQKGLEYLRIACALKPSAIRTLMETGALATKLAYYGQAVEIYSRAVAADPSNIAAINGFISALRRVGGSSAAVADAYKEYLNQLMPPRK